MTDTIFISYSHKDEEHKDYVVGHLKVAEKQSALKTWDDRRVKGGGAWRKEIKAALAEAKIAIILVSHHSLTSDFILDEEVSAMLQRRDKEGLLVYPIVIRGCAWEAVDWLKTMNLRPVDGMPLAFIRRPKRDLVMADIIRELLESLGEVVENDDATVQVSTLYADDEMDRLLQHTEALSSELGTTKTALNAMFEILAEQNVPAEQLDAKLREIAERHVNLTKRLHALSQSNDEPEIVKRRDQAVEAIEEGEYDQADQLLAEAEDIDDEALCEQQEALDRRKLSKARTRSERAELERARLNYLKAAQHFAKAASLVPASDSHIRLGYLMAQASTLDALGREFGYNEMPVSKALEFFKKVRADQEQVLDPGHKERLRIRTYIAHWTGETGNHEEALRLLKELLSDQEQNPDQDRRDTLRTRNSIAYWTGKAGNRQEALRLFKELLPDQERLLGSDHRDTLGTRNSIAYWTGEKGNGKEALRLFRKLLPERNRILRANHPDILRTRNSIAHWTGETGNHQKALRLFKELLPDQERVLGPDHPNTLGTRNSIAHWTGEAGNRQEALRLFRELLPDQERVLGPDHKDTLGTRNSIAHWSRDGR